MWSVPSRNRPHLIAKMFDIAPPSTPGFIAIDSDQIKLYKKVKLPSGWFWDVSKRADFGPKQNRLFQLHPRLSWYGSINDDMVPLTQGWDLEIIKAAGDWGIAWAEDLLTHRAGCLVVGGELVRACGFFFVPSLQHFYTDSGIELMARELPGCVGPLSKVIVEHRHYSNKKAKWDLTYRQRPKQQDEKPIFEKWKAEQWPALKERLINAIGNYRAGNGGECS